MMQKPTDDHPPDTVIEEVGKGFRLHDRVLRPTKVIVSRRPEGDSPESSAVAQTTEEDSPGSK